MDKKQFIEQEIEKNKLAFGRWHSTDKRNSASPIKLLFGGSPQNEGVSGVTFAKRYGKWAAEITFKGKRTHLLYTDDFFEACCVRKSAEHKCGFHPNYGRA